MPQGGYAMPYRPCWNAALGTWTGGYGWLGRPATLHSDVGFNHQMSTLWVSTVQYPGLREGPQSNNQHDPFPAAPFSHVHLPLASSRHGCQPCEHMPAISAGVTAGGGGGPACVCCSVVLIVQKPERQKGT
jgi:hypothetical protein